MVPLWLWHWCQPRAAGQALQCQPAQCLASPVTVTAWQVPRSPHEGLTLAAMLASPTHACGLAVCCHAWQHTQPWALMGLLHDVGEGTCTCVATHVHVMAQRVVSADASADASAVADAWPSRTRARGPGICEHGRRATPSVFTSCSVIINMLTC